MNETKFNESGCTCDTGSGSESRVCSYCKNSIDTRLDKIFGERKKQLRMKENMKFYVNGQSKILEIGGNVFFYTNQNEAIKGAEPGDEIMEVVLKSLGKVKTETKLVPIKSKKKSKK